MSDADTPPTVVPARSSATAVLIAVALGALVAVGLGVFGKVHEPQYFSINLAGFSSGLAVKAWLATVAMALALFQLVSAFAMYRLIPKAQLAILPGADHFLLFSRPDVVLALMTTFLDAPAPTPPS